MISECPRYFLGSCLRLDIVGKDLKIRAVRVHLALAQLAKIADFTWYRYVLNICANRQLLLYDALVDGHAVTAIFLIEAQVPRLKHLVKGLQQLRLIADGVPLVLVQPVQITLLIIFPVLGALDVASSELAGVYESQGFVIEHLEGACDVQWLVGGGGATIEQSVLPTVANVASLV